MDNLTYLYPLVAFTALAVGATYLEYRWSRRVLRRWTEENGYQLVEADYSFFKGPFFWNSTRGQAVYRVKVQDSTGQTHRGWVRLGSMWWGL